VAEEIVKRAREDVAEAEKKLKAAKELIERLRRAGEDVSELEREQRRIEMRIQRYKRAFAE